MHDQAQDFDACTRIVGKYGYAEASVARITEEAGVAQGTFYNHFENRQELLDQLLPKIGLDMVRFSSAIGPERRTRRGRKFERFAAFFDFIREVAEFLRISTKPSSCAGRLPEASRQYFHAYVRILRRARPCRRDR